VFTLPQVKEGVRPKNKGSSGNSYFKNGSMDGLFSEDLVELALEKRDPDDEKLREKFLKRLARCL
jgi:hypothetical protein